MQQIPTVARYTITNVGTRVLQLTLLMIMRPLHQQRKANPYLTTSWPQLEGGLHLNYS